MLNNEAGQNYVVLASRLWGIPRPQTSPGLLLCACCSERAEGGGALNMKMELMYQHPKVDYSVATLLAMLPSVWDQQQKEKRFIHHGNWRFLLLPGGI